MYSGSKHDTYTENMLYTFRGFSVYACSRSTELLAQSKQLYFKYTIS